MGKNLRRPLSFLYFTNELQPWYFKYIIGGIVTSIVVTGGLMYLSISRHIDTIKVLGMTLPGTSESPVNIARDMLLNIRGAMLSTIIIEGIILIIVGFFISMYFSYKLIGPLKRIEREINDKDSNATRFVIISKTPGPSKGKEKTAAYSGANNKCYKTGM